MDEAPIGLFMAFFLPFHVIGGAALGTVARRLFQGGFKLSNLAGSGLTILWGAMFGGLPLLFGLVIGSIWLLLFQLIIFIGSIIAVALFYDWLRDLYRLPEMWVASFGFVFLMVGIGLTIPILSKGNTDALLVSLIFAGVGGLLTLLGVVPMLRR